MFLRVAAQRPVPKKSALYRPRTRQLINPNYNMEPMLRDISRDIWASLGPGYSESVYHCAFEVALRARGLYYENVGHVRADLIVDRKCVIELKSVSKLNETYRIQTQNYLNLLDLNQGYLINFPDKKGNFEFEVIARDKPIEPTPDQIDC